jgi:hypothetical protein
MTAEAGNPELAYRLMIANPWIPAFAGMTM